MQQLLHISQQPNTFIESLQKLSVKKSIGDLVIHAVTNMLHIRGQEFNSTQEKTLRVKLSCYFHNFFLPRYCLGNSWKEAMPTYTSPAYDLHHVHKLESKCTGIKL